MNKVEKFIPRPIAKEGIRYEGKLTIALIEFTGGEIIDGLYNGPLVADPDGGYRLHTSEGLSYILTTDDYVMKDINGNFYPCKADVLVSTYEKVND